MRAVGIWREDGSRAGGDGGFELEPESFTNVLNGITPTTDPMTGERREVWTGTNANYWVNGLGEVVNSNSAQAAGWRQLQVQPN